MDIDDIVFDDEMVYDIPQATNLPVDITSDEIVLEIIKPFGIPRSAGQ